MTTLFERALVAALHGFAHPRSPRSPAATALVELRQVSTLFSAAEVFDELLARGHIEYDDTNRLVITSAGSEAADVITRSGPDPTVGGG